MKKKYNWNFICRTSIEHSHFPAFSNDYKKEECSHYKCMYRDLHCLNQTSWAHCTWMRAQLVLKWYFVFVLHQSNCKLLLTFAMYIFNEFGTRFHSDGLIFSICSLYRANLFIRSLQLNPINQNFSAGNDIIVTEWRINCQALYEDLPSS